MAVAAVISIALIILIAIIVDRAFRKLNGWLFSEIVKRLRSETPDEWESALRHRLVAKRSAHLVGTLVFYWLIPYAVKDFPDALRFLQNVIEGYLVIVGTLTVNSFLSASKDVWDGTDLKIGVPVSVASQALQIVVWVVGSILAISVAFDQSVTVLLSGMAGMTAILALVFRDSILGFVAGIQLSGNDMLRTGDWIDVPQYGASGTVEEIGLTTVKVRNFDKTISTVPSYALVSQSFKNWRGMKEFDARRIKRSLRLDMNQVRFLSEDELLQLRSNQMLEGFWAGRKKQASANPAVAEDAGKLTNLSLFHDYLSDYLNHHPDICHDKLTMVRQLEPDAQGLPVEIYCFCADIQWSHYESVQWKIMDHILAILPCFDLKAFQLPTDLISSVPNIQAGGSTNS
jgi:miniconductance mechanosensitive channel